MEVQLYFGPDKIPFLLDEKGMVIQNVTIPFHGIISRGLINEIASINEIGQLWQRYAPILFEENLLLNNPEFEILKREANALGVLSFGQSALAAKKYVEQHLLNRESINNLTVDIWNIKEGHTSSVWKVVVNGGGVFHPFILNVARDKEASIELKESSEKLMIIGNKFPNMAMAKVIEIVTLEDDFLPFPVIITQNEWVDNSFEIHAQKNINTGEEELLLVERFLTNRDNPTKIISVFGRRFNSLESKRINENINHFITSASDCLNEKPNLNINEGDVVWDGEKAVVVALS